jgi:hypothetical protein
MGGESLMENTVVVGFGYKARSGKDESCKAILEARTPQFEIRKYAFADELKREINEAAEAAGGMLELFKQGCPYRGSEVMFPSWVMYDPNPDMTDMLCPLGKQRLLQQWWGTEYRRAQDPNYWVNKLRDIIEAEKPAVALISDLRFPNEVSWIKSSIDNCVVRVDRLGYKSTTPDHPSEHALDFMDDGDWHYIIQVPDGDLEELQRDAVVVFDLIIQSLTPPDLNDVTHVEAGQVIKALAS